MDVQHSAEFQQYLDRKENLQHFIERALKIVADLEMTTWQENIQRLQDRLLFENFKALVMGEFNRGKSTVINAFLGQKVLPSLPIPTTAIINEVKWGDTKRALLHWLPEGAETKPPEEIPIGNIADYVVIQDNTTGHFGGTQVVYQSPYEKVELFWPLEICRNGVEIIDSPGLNEDIERQKITLDYLKTVDVVIFVIACDFPVGATEIQLLDVVKAAGHEYLFFVVNRINMIDEEDRPLVTNRCVKLLSPYTKEGKNFIFFVNAKGALEGKLHGNEYLVEESNMRAFEEKLQTFLAHERGRIKLLRPAIELSATLHEAIRIVPERKGLFQVTLKELEERQRIVKERLISLETIQKNVGLLFADARTEIKGIASSHAANFYDTMAGNVARWVTEQEAQEKIKIHEVFSQSARERVAEEVTTFLTKKIREEQEQWQKTTLEPLLNGRFNRLALELEKSTSEFADIVVEARLDLIVGDDVELSDDVVNVEKVSVMSRILGAAGGFLIGGLGSMTVGAAFGFDEMLRSLLPQIAITIAVVVLIGWNPVVLIPALLLGGLFQGFLKNNSLSKKIREATAKEYAAKLREKRYELANKVAQAADEKLVVVQQSLNNAYELEIANVREQMNSVLAHKRQEQSHVDMVVEQLHITEQEVSVLSSEVDAFVKLIALEAV